ncbi:hypothetical protein [Parachlamydia sp. AcF125]|uniref:hypothetical protein n=1 Tax=Parachlamydia sp. AcF125 TaxID=2795736 RepID=UPI001BD80C9B|nr:hypothetical protein [Parachlamydia sp. AcF125]MBS4168182.1 hypothetical protein [Parachlamydia sp. AcF125]
MGAPPAVQQGFCPFPSSIHAGKKSLENPSPAEEFCLPKTSKKSPPTGDNSNSAQKELESKEAQGFQIPSVLKKIWDFMNKASDIIVMAIGVPLKYTGLCFLVIGAVHFGVVLCLSVPQVTLATGLMAIICALIKSGALPTIVAGAALYKFGADLIENKALPSLSLVPLVFPLPFFQWLNMGKAPSPMDPS